MNTDNQPSLYTVLALYKFVKLDDYCEIKQPLLEFCLSHNILGSILLANEGINGTVAGSDTAINNLMQYLQQDSRFVNLEAKLSYAISPPFYRMKVKLKREIVTLGCSNIDPTICVGEYLSPQQWNKLLATNTALVIDTRNYYESNIGKFTGAICPNTESFRDFPDFFAKNLSHYPKDTPIAMYCTGGIRCEKSTAYLLQQGFTKVYHLQGGILNYLEKIPAHESLWEGECFVFDNRVAVDQNLCQGSYAQCFGCRHPLSAEDKQHPDFKPGISCSRCINRSAISLSRASERHNQVVLAKQQGKQHIGSLTNN